MPRMQPTHDTSLANSLETKSCDDHGSRLLSSIRSKLYVAVPDDGRRRAGARAAVEQASLPPAYAQRESQTDILNVDSTGKTAAGIVPTNIASRAMLENNEIA